MTSLHPPASGYTRSQTTGKHWLDFSHWNSSLTHGSIKVKWILTMMLCKSTATPSTVSSPLTVWNKENPSNSIMYTANKLLTPENFLFTQYFSKNSKKVRAFSFKQAWTSFEVTSQSDWNTSLSSFKLIQLKKKSVYPVFRLKIVILSVHNSEL